MLLKNAHPNPLIHLRGVNKTILKCVIEFIYLGQTEVDIMIHKTMSRYLQKTAHLIFVNTSIMKQVT